MEQKFSEISDFSLSVKSLKHGITGVIQFKVLTTLPITSS